MWRGVVHGSSGAAFLVRHTGEREPHLDAGKRAEQHEIVEVAKMADAEYLV